MGNNRDEMEEIDNVIILNDENGNPVSFEFLDLIEYDGAEYVVLWSLFIAVPKKQPEEIMRMPLPGRAATKRKGRKSK